ncbi:MAG: DNA ligase D [Thiohalocapsa sp.]
MPRWIRPQLTQVVEAPPHGADWLHEIKFDGYRMHARLDHGEARLLTRTGLDWTHKYRHIAAALEALPAAEAYLDGELCGVRPDGTTLFSMIQAASDSGNAEALMFFAFDLLFLDGTDLMAQPLRRRKARLAELLSGSGPPLQYSDHQEGRGAAFYVKACQLGLEGVVSKQAAAPYVPGDRGLWVKTKCLNREEFVVVGWTDPEGARPLLGALLLAYHDEDGRLVYAGRAGAGIAHAELQRLWRKLQPLATQSMPLAAPPPRGSRFGSPLVLSRVHWVRPELVAEVTFLAWTEEGLLRQVIYQGLREDKPARKVRRPASLPAPEPPPSPQPSAGRFPARQKSLPVPRENILQLLSDAVAPSREQLTAYWSRVAERALSYLARRPLKLVRHVKGTTFYHMGRLPPIPPAVHQLKIRKREGGEGTRLWVDDLAGLLGLVEIGAVELHPWGATVDDIEHPDTLVFDLDPGPGIGWEFVVDTACRLRSLLAEEGLDPWPKLSGGKGLHIMAPIARGIDWEAAHRYARRLAQRLAGSDPARYVTVADLKAREGKLFIDYLRNGRGTTAVGAYSPRARSGFPIAAPVSWQDVEHGIRPDAFSFDHPPSEAGIAALEQAIRANTRHGRA